MTPARHHTLSSQSTVIHTNPVFPANCGQAAGFTRPHQTAAKISINSAWQAEEGGRAVHGSAPKQYMGLQIAPIAWPSTPKRRAQMPSGRRFDTADSSHINTRVTRTAPPPPCLQPHPSLHMHACLVSGRGVQVEYWMISSAHLLSCTPSLNRRTSGSMASRSAPGESTNISLET